MVRFPVCLNTNTYRGYSLTHAMDGAQRAGIHLIEISVADACQHIDPHISNKDLRTLQAALKERKLHVVAIGGHANLTTSAGRSQFGRNLELGARLGVRYVVTGTGETHDDSTTISDRTEFSQRVRELAGTAHDLGIQMAIETHGANYATGAQLLGLLREVDSPGLAINYDTGNTIFYAGVEPYDDLESCLSDVAGIHLKDKAGAQNEWNFPAIGEGATDFPRIARILTRSPRAISVPLSIEIEFTPLGPSSVDEIHAAVLSSRETVERLW